MESKSTSEPIDGAQTLTEWDAQKPQPLAPPNASARRYAIERRMNALDFGMVCCPGTREAILYAELEMMLAGIDAK